MKKLLYIPVNSKPEEMSISKTMGRKFVNRFLTENTDYVLEELDLYNEYIPEINHMLFEGRGEPVSGDRYYTLIDEDRKAIDRINQLCNQFLEADTYVIAAPMWSSSFPSRLKRYMDCIIINNKVIKIRPEKNEVEGLLGDKKRNMVYIQSSGGVYPKLFGGKYNHGVDYFHDIFKFLGIDKFEKILVEGTGDPAVEVEKAIKKAYKDIDDIMEKFSGRSLAGV